MRILQVRSIWPGGNRKWASAQQAAAWSESCCLKTSQPRIEVQSAPLLFNLRFVLGFIEFLRHTVNMFIASEHCCYLEIISPKISADDIHDRTKKLSYQLIAACLHLFVAAIIEVLGARTLHSFACRTWKNRCPLMKFQCRMPLLRWTELCAVVASETSLVCFALRGLRRYLNLDLLWSH